MGQDTDRKGPTMTDVAGLYFDIESGIRRFHNEVFAPPTGIDLNGDDWAQLQRQFAGTFGDTLQGLPVTVVEDVKPGEYRLTGQDERRAQLADVGQAASHDGHIMIGIVGQAPDLVGECSCGERMHAESIAQVGAAHATHRLLTSDDG